VYVDTKILGERYVLSSDHLKDKWVEKEKSKKKKKSEMEK